MGPFFVQVSQTQNLLNVMLNLTQIFSEKAQRTTFLYVKKYIKVHKLVGFPIL